MSSPKSLAIIVTFQPDLTRLSGLLDTLRVQADAVVVVDNGSGQDIKDFIASRKTTTEALIANDKNMGIAAAQNQGIAQARKQQFDYVILFDQDSLPQENLLATLVGIAEAKKKDGELVAAIGPNFRDARLQKSAQFLRTSGWKSHLQPETTGDVVVVDHLIASGCLIPMQALDRVGDMREELFIDYVDTEWSLRAEHRYGLLSYGTYKTTLQHELGQHPVQVFGKHFAIHAATRHYYLFRNSVWLWRQNWVPLGWKMARGPKLMMRLVFCAIFGRPILAQWRMIALGLWHGIAGRMGKLDET